MQRKYLLRASDTSANSGELFGTGPPQGPFSKGTCSKPWKNAAKADKDGSGEMIWEPTPVYSTSVME
jgi:hypothetical protein